VCPAEVSCTTAEGLLNLLIAHSVKVVRHRDLPGHETEAPYLSTDWSAKGSDFYDWFASLGNDERLPFDASSMSFESWVFAS
jgi:hypothetical protein